MILDGNDIWEALFGICKGNVPDGMTEDVCQQLAECIAAQAIEARSGETRQGLDPKDESAVSCEADAPNLGRQNISDVLIEALEPFAQACTDTIDEEERDSSSTWEHPVGMALSVADFRRAVGALRQAKGDA